MAVRDSIHKLTTMLTSNYAWIAIEDLNVKGMMSNGKLARHIADGAFSEIRRQSEYKAKMRESHVAVVSRWFPSSKTCNACGCINEFLTLADRERRWLRSKGRNETVPCEAGI